MTGGATVPESRSTRGEAITSALDTDFTWRSRSLPPILLGALLLFDSWDVGLISYVAPVLAKEWHLGSLFLGTVLSAGYAGQFFGALLCGALAERWGRVPVLYFAIIVMSVLSVACAFLHSAETMIVVRFVQGIAIGGALPVAASYINEIAPSQHRGRYFSLFQSLTMSGYVWAALFSVLIIPHLGWRCMFIVGGLPILSLPFVWARIPESPRWLARKGRFSEVDRALVKLGARSLPPFAGLESAYDEPASAKPGVSALFQPEIRGQTITVMALWFLVSFVSFGLVTWVPTLLTTVFKMPLQDALAVGAVNSVLFLIAAPLAALVLDRFGRRPPAIVAALLSVVALVILAFLKPHQLPFVIAMLILGKLSAAVGSVILWPFSAEVFPTRIRALGLGVASSLGRAASMTTPLVVGLVLSFQKSPTAVFLVFAGCGVGVLLLWWLAAVETLGQSLRED